MVDIVKTAKQGSRGVHSKLSIPEQILLTLQYLREYRTFFHIAQDWGIHESTAHRIVKRIEDVLIQDVRQAQSSRRGVPRAGKETVTRVRDRNRSYCGGCHRNRS